MYLLILFLLTKVAFAQESYKIEGNANNVIIDLVDQKFEALGGSTATFTNIKIEARKITKDKDKNRIIAEGKITYLQDNKYKVVADTMELDLDKKIAKMKKGKTALNKFYLTGEDIEAKFPEKLIVNNATVTTCSHDRPHFHIKAKRVDFYPDAKFIGYQGWIYIGENFRLFPVPIYGSYVTEKENRAPLFPKIDYDQKKGALVIYGIDFKVLDNKKIGPIDRVNLEGLINLEYSQNRGLGFNKIRAGYSAMEIFRGETFVEDWISAPTESEDSMFLEKEKAVKNQMGTSYKFVTRNSIKSNKGLAWKLTDGSYLLGNSNINFEYRNTNSDLVKDEYGRYVKKNIANKSSQTELALEQKIWKYMNITYKFRSLDASDEVIKLLFDAYDEKANEKAESDKYFMDTKRENNLKIVQDDFRTHKFIGELRRNFDLRPEKGKAGKSKVDNRDYLEGTFNRLGIRAEYENLEKDIWKRKYSSIKNENYVENEEIKKNFKVSLGKYYLFGTKFNYKLNYEFLNRETKTFDEPKDILQDDKSKQAEAEYQNRNNFLLKDEKFNYHSTELQIKNDNFSLLELDNTSLALEPIYSIELRKYIKEDGTILTLEEQEKYRAFNDYVDVIIHKLSYSIPFTLYDNSSYVNRKLDFKLTTTPKAERIFIQGRAPKGQKAPEPLKIYGNQIDVDFGNTKSSYIFKAERNYDLFEEDFLIKNYSEHEGSIKLEDLNLFTFQIKDKLEWDVKGEDPSHKFFQKYKLDLDYIGGSYKRNRENIFYRDLTTNNLKKQKIASEDEYSLTILGLTGKYLIENLEDIYHNNDNKNRDSERTKWSLEYEKEFKESYRKYKLKGSYEKELDKRKGEYKDSTVALSLELTDNSEVIKEKERKEEEARSIDLQIEENKKEIEKNEELLSQQEEEKSEDEDPIDKEFESDEAFFVKEEEIDKILEEPEIKNSKTLMDLGEEFKEEKIEDKSKKFLLELKLVSNASEFSFYDLGWNIYKKELKQINLRALLKYSTYFEVEYIINNKRPDMDKPHSEYEMLGHLKLQLGYKDYEWHPGFSFKRNVKENRWDEIFGTLDHNMHCTKISLKAGIAWNEQKNIQVFAYGINFEIREFPEKNLGFTVKGNKVENGSFGL